MKILSYLTLIVLFCSCQTEPYIKYELNAEKQGVCKAEASPTKMISNIVGERYEFYTCLPEDFNVKDFALGRRGDTLLSSLYDIKLTGKTAWYKLTLDVDVYPKYRCIKLADNNIVAIAPVY